VSPSILPIPLSLTLSSTILPHLFLSSQLLTPHPPLSLFLVLISSQPIQQTLLLAEEQPETRRSLPPPLSQDLRRPARQTGGKSGDRPKRVDQGGDGCWRYRGEFFSLLSIQTTPTRLVDFETLSSSRFRSTLPSLHQRGRRIFHSLSSLSSLSCFFSPSRS